MTRTLYAYHPADVRSLAMLILADLRKERREAYFADLLLTTLHYASHGNDHFPPIGDVFPPYLPRSERAMSGADTQRMLVNRWKKHKEARERHESI